MNEDLELFSLPRTAEIAGISSTQLRRLIKSGGLPEIGRIVSGRRIFTAEEVDDILITLLGMEAGLA